MKITALRVQKRNKRRVNVYLDDEYAFALFATDAAALRVGQEVSPEMVASLQTGDERQKVMNHATQFLAHRPRSVQEVRRRMREKDYSVDVIEAVLARLHELDLLDDGAFVRYWIEQREQFRPRSRAMLRYELAQKGVARDVVDTALQSVDENMSALRAAQNWAASKTGLEPEQFRKKLGSFLSRRGFSYSVAREAMEHLENEMTEHESEEVV